MQNEIKLDKIHFLKLLKSLLLSEENLLQFNENFNDKNIINNYKLNYLLGLSISYKKDYLKITAYINKLLYDLSYVNWFFPDGSCLILEKIDNLRLISSGGLAKEFLTDFSQVIILKKVV